MNDYLKKKQTLRERRLKIQRWFLSTTCRVMLLGAIVSFGTLYIMQTSSISTKGYEMRDLDKQKIELEEELDRLEFDIAKHRSMQSIQERLKTMNMVAVAEVEYVSPVGSTVVRR